MAHEDATQLLEDAYFSNDAPDSAIDPTTLDGLLQKRRLDMLSQSEADRARQSQTNPSLQDYVLMSHGLQSLPPIQNED